MYINFDYDMNHTEILIEDMLVQIKASYNIRFTWQASFVNTTSLKVAISVATVLEGTEKLIVRLINYKAFRGQYGG